MKYLTFALFLFFAAPLHAQVADTITNHYLICDSIGHVTGQFFWNKASPLPARAFSVAGLTDIQLYWKDFLRRTKSGWQYTGPDTLPVYVPSPDPNIARRVALRAVGFTQAQTDALLQIFGQ